MPTWVLLTIVIASIAIPARAALDPDPRRGLRHAAYAMFMATALYVVAVLYVLPRLL